MYRPGQDRAAGPTERAGSSERDPSAEFRRSFWSLVVLLNLSILALSVGAMLAGFRGAWTTGGGLVLVGTAGLLAAVVRYRRTRRQLAAAGDGDGTD